jgi:hypothetical protein
MGLAGGPRPGRRGSGRAFGLGPIEKDRFFWKIISSAKQIQEKPRKCLKAQKIPRKSQNSQENSQRQIET